MIICRTPFRISFFGGGTDYPEWYLNNGGAVLSTSINKYCHISIRYLPPFFEHRIRLAYSRIELCQRYDEIQHPAVRETLRYMNLDRGVEIHHDGDLPARSGMGSSSSFTVGMLHAVYGLKGVLATKEMLAKESIHIEQNMIRETVGSQDQVAAAYGGLNHIRFHTNGEFDVYPLTIPITRSEELNSHLMLFYTGIMRTASDVVDSYIMDLQSKRQLLEKMQQMVNEGISILQSNRSIHDFGRLLHEAWMAKKGLGKKVSNAVVDQLYQVAMNNGALGGKITGAGGGGFLLLFVPPYLHEQVRRALDKLIYIPFRFEHSGSRIIIYEPQFDEYVHLDRRLENHCVQSFRELSAISG